ncbi:UNVERIFIED_CONTAM: hypothetical protein GTU68_066288 [Idotea baltica]|nr:hypothetical protein [Idotea baltica]
MDRIPSFSRQRMVLSDPSKERLKRKAGLLFHKGNIHTRCQQEKTSTCPS